MNRLTPETYGFNTTNPLPDHPTDNNYPTLLEVARAYLRDVMSGKIARQGLERMVQDPMQAAMDWMNPAAKIGGMLGQIAYHGSPHKFTKFSLSKIGTGEGAQAYGHGLYFAENPNVAKGYRNALSDMNPIQQNRIGLQDELSWLQQQEQIARSSGNHDLADKFIKKYAAVEKELNLLEKPGGLYKVDIPDEAIGKMLDWDKPLSQQSEHVKSALKKVFGDLPENRRLMIEAPTPEMAEKLRKAGIVGIKYLDQGSRTAGQGTRNFVVFDENLVKILERK